MAAPALLPALPMLGVISALGLGTGLGVGLGVGLGCTKSHCKREASNNEVILRFSNPNNSAVESFHGGLIVLGADDPNNHTAIFKHDNGEYQGTLTGFPTRDENGVMQGNFSIPGLDEQQGDWISVNRSVADNTTLCVFDKAKDLVTIKSELPEASFNGMMEDLKAAYC